MHEKPDSSSLFSLPGPVRIQHTARMQGNLVKLLLRASLSGNGATTVHLDAVHTLNMKRLRKPWVFQLELVPFTFSLQYLGKRLSLVIKCVPEEADSCLFLLLNLRQQPSSASHLNLNYIYNQKDLIYYMLFQI